MKWALRLSLLVFAGACSQPQELELEIIRSTAEGNRLQKVEIAELGEEGVEWSLYPDSTFQEIKGFGGAFTESSAHLWTKLKPELQKELIEAYFSDTAAAYNMGRTHINSSDFSLESYDYLNGDTSLASFSLAKDEDDIIPMIKAAQALEPELRLIASPWTAPPFMKDNQAWFGGKLKPEYYSLWADYFVKYHQSMGEHGISPWAYTVENEPLGNDANWESMHYTPQEMATFVKENLAPAFSQAGIETNILVYDQNRGEELEEWANILLTDSALKPLIYGTAVHWYTSTYDWFPESLEHTHNLAPEKAIVHTEACVDAEVPHWQDDAWYWKKEATDWGYDWAKEEDKYLHPKYVPVYRYARDIIGAMNSWVEGWVDWNMLLDPGGGPNHARNWCVAPVLADTLKQELYYTPLYDVMRHFSAYIPAGSKRILHGELPQNVMALTVQRPDGKMVAVLLNTGEESAALRIKINEKARSVSLPGASLQTLILK